MKVIGTSQVVTNSRITIPPEVRRILEVEVGDIVQWVQYGEFIYLEKAQPSIKPPVVETEEGS